MGVSKDRLASQRRFVEKQSLSFPVLADPDGEAARAFGVRSWLGVAKRVSFLIDGEGVVRKVYDSVSPAGHAAEVARDVEALAAGGLD